MEGRRESLRAANCWLLLDAIQKSHPFFSLESPAEKCRRLEFVEDAEIESLQKALLDNNTLSESIVTIKEKILKELLNTVPFRRFAVFTQNGIASY